MPGFALDWFAGPSAQVELQRHLAATEQYQLRYVSPFRPTIRVPSPGPPLTASDLSSVQRDFDAIFAGVVGRSTPAPTGAAALPLESDLIDVGGNLLQLTLPPSVEADFRSAKLFLDIGVDQRLVGFPWELMHDGTDFLCLKHYIGRFVNVEDAGSALAARPTTWLGTPIEKLSVLLVSVPQPIDRPGGVHYETLQGARQEATDVLKALTAIPDVTVTPIKDNDATLRTVVKELRSGRHHLIHFSGHATTGGLVLQDNDLSATMLRRYVNYQTPPILCFINACDSGNTTEWTANYDMFDIARAFLETGSYLLGSRWKLPDSSAATFAAAFYNGFIKRGQAIGESIQEARRVCRTNGPTDLAWASYVYYGDPRVQFRRP